MVSDGTASWIDGPDLYDAADLRRLDSVLLAPGGPVSQPFAVREGRRVNGAGLQVTVGGSPESWTATPGPCVVSDPAYAGQGGWRVEIPNAKSGPIGARPGAGTSRIDLIVARVYDTAAIGSGPAEVVIERLLGQAGQTPSAPTPPAGSIVFELARLAVPASGTVVVTPSTERTVAAGGILPVPTTAVMDKLKTDGIAYRGLVVDNAQTDSLHRYNGTAWKRLTEDGPIFEYGNSYRWGVAFNAATHRRKTYIDSVVGEPSAGGDIQLIGDLKTKFAGFIGATATFGDLTNGHELATWTSGDILACRLRDSAGNGITAGNNRVDFVVHGWV